MSDDLQILTNSRARRFRSCQRRHEIEYDLGFRSAVEGEPVRFGNIWHEGVETYRGGLMLGYAVEECEAHARDAVALRTEDDYYLRAAIFAVLGGYVAYWRSDDTVKWMWEGVERSFRMPILNPDTGRPSMRFCDGGKIDAIVFGQHDNRRYVVENKTTSADFSDPTEDYWARLEIDSQLSGYVLGSESIGLPVDSCLYDVVRRPSVRPYKATPVEDRKYTATASKLKDGTVRPAGSLYANQREADETPAEFSGRISAMIAEDPTKWFARREVPRNEDQIRGWMRDTWVTIHQIRENQLAKRSPRNPDACFSREHGKCPFFDVCAYGASLESNPDRWVRLSDPHPELA